MMEVMHQADGQFAVYEIDGTSLNDVLAVFPTQIEADEWMLSRTLKDDINTNGLGTIRPGGGQGIS